MDQETLDRVEEQRLELESNIAKLRKSLRHWQTLEIEYEGLKEEFQGLPEDASTDECLQAARDFKAELVDEKDLQSLLGGRTGRSGKPSQLVEIFSKRVDYVLKNVTTIRNQLEDAKNKLNALLLAKEPGHQDEAALPLGEIIEELDEDGQIISSKVQVPGKDANDLLNILHKAGVPDVEPREGSKSRETESESHLSKVATRDSIAAATIEPALTVPSMERAFAEESPREERDQAEEIDPSSNIVGDTEEEAVLRQEMLQYGLDEAGAIVAELDLQDFTNLSDDEEGDYLSDYDEDEDLYTDESEEENGATRNPVISDRYKRQMEALSQKHGITDLKNLGPEPEVTKSVQEQLHRPSAAEAARKAAIARDDAARSGLKEQVDTPHSSNIHQKQKKKVAFSPLLDIAKDEPPPPPIGDTVIERPTTDYGSAMPSASAPITPKKQSRFKAARSTTPQTPLYPPPMSFTDSTSLQPAPSGPPNLTIAPTLIERPTTSTAPIDPADFNDALHQRELAVEYQKMRNRRIHEQGGYVAGGEAENYGEEVVPLEEIDEQTGQVKKVSRFKAARLNKA